MVSATTERRYQIALVSVLLLLLMVSIWAFLVLAYSRTPQARARQSVTVPLVGTWIGEQGNLIDLRSDGTGRARSSRSDKDILYFEWTRDAREFAIYQYAKKYSFGWFLKRALLDDTPTTRYTLIRELPTEFTLRTASGEEYTYFSTRDETLESVP